MSGIKFSQLERLLMQELIYFNQANKYKELAKKTPNLYQWVLSSFYNILVPIGLTLSISAIVLLSYIVYTSREKLLRTD